MVNLVAKILNLTSLKVSTEAQVQAFLKRITATTLLIRESEGMVFDEKTWQERAGLIQNLTTQTLKGGHHLHLDNPEVLLPVLSPFLAE